MILVMLPLSFGIGLPTILALFWAMSGSISCTISNLTRVLLLVSLLLRWVFSERPHILNASSISDCSSGRLAMASLASEVKGTFVEATCTSMMAGPNGIPLPPRCSRPYRRQSVFSMALVTTHAPC